MSYLTQLLTQDIVLYKLSPMLDDMDNYHLFTTNNYNYMLAPAVKLKSEHKYEYIAKTKFIPTNITIEMINILFYYYPNLKNEMKPTTEIYSYISELNHSINQIVINNLSHIKVLNYYFTCNRTSMQTIYKEVINDEILLFYFMQIGDFEQAKLNEHVSSIFYNSGALPPNLHTLLLFQLSSSGIFKNLPYNLHTLEIESTYNDSLDDLPPNLHTLILRNLINQSIDHLPTNLRILKIGNGFNQSIENLPVNLHTLELGGNFNQPIDKLPKSIKILSLGYFYDQSIDNLPPTLHTLNIGGNFSQPINKLPKTLRILTLDFYNDLLDDLPNSIHTLILPGRYQPIYKLPLNLCILKVSRNFDHLISYYPNKLQELHIGNDVYKFKL
jgi:hypothetical protein